MIAPMMRDWRFGALAYAVLGITFFPLAEWLPTQPFGTGVLMSYQFVYLLPVAIAALCSPVLMVGMLFKSSRRTACLLLIFALAGCVGGLCGMRLGDIARMSGIRNFARRSESLVRAVRQYEHDHGEPPKDLDSLVPHYLASTPTTGMAAYPEYAYHHGLEAEVRFQGNPWALTVDTPRRVFKWDMMVYLPNQNYPEYGYGGFLTRVGSWAYVDE